MQYVEEQITKILDSAKRDFPTEPENSLIGLVRNKLRDEQSYKTNKEIYDGLVNAVEKARTYFKEQFDNCDIVLPEKLRTQKGWEELIKNSQVVYTKEGAARFARTNFFLKTEDNVDKLFEPSAVAVSYSGVKYVKKLPSIFQLYLMSKNLDVGRVCLYRESRYGAEVRCAKNRNGKREYYLSFKL